MKPSRLSTIAQTRLQQIEQTIELACTPQKVNQCYQTGGKAFVDAVTQFGANDRGETIAMPDWYREYLECIGDFRLPETFTSGCSQVGKTLGHTLLNCYCIAALGLDTLWSYDQFTSMRIQVKSNFRPVMKAWLKNAGIPVTRMDGDEIQLFQLRGAEAQFTAVSTTTTNSKDGTAVAGGNVVGVSRDILFIEERSQCKAGSTDPLKRRLDAGRLPTRPVRELGTPGSGLGIEEEIDRADYHFYPHCRCKECDRDVPLDPKGCLLIATIRTVDGKPTKRYLSEIGKPIAWWHHDETDPINSAYFACPSCGAELSGEVRSNAYFACLKTKVRLRQFLDALPPGVPSASVSAGITLSPLLRVEQTNVAARIVRAGLETRNPADWQQQSLGHPSESTRNAVTLDMLRAAIAAPFPTRKPDLILAGLDQGRGEDWLMIAGVWLPENHQGMKTIEKMERSIRGVLFGGATLRSQVPAKLAQMGVTYGLMDAEPDIPDAAKLCDRTCLEMGDQKSGTDYDARKGTVRSGGEEFPCWAIRQEDFLRQVLHGFLLTAPDGLPLYRLPESWEKWVGLRTDQSPLVHLSAPSCDPVTLKWNRGANHVDDLYYAAMWLEAAFFLAVAGLALPPKRNYSVGGTINDIRDRLDW